MNNNNNEYITELIKLGRYKDVIKFLDEDDADKWNSKTGKKKFNREINDMNNSLSLNSDMNVNDTSGLEKLGYDKELIERLENLNKYNKELKLLDKEFNQDEFDVDKSLNVMDHCMNINLVEISDFSRLESNQEETKLSIAKDDSFLDIVTAPENFMENPKIDADDDKNSNLFKFNKLNQNINIEKLLREDEENVNRLRELNENILMQKEEIYGINHQLSERKKRFMYMESPLKQFSEVLINDVSFKKDYVHKSSRILFNINENHYKESSISNLEILDLCEAELDIETSNYETIECTPIVDNTSTSTLLRNIFDILTTNSNYLKDSISSSLSNKLLKDSKNQNIRKNINLQMDKIYKKISQKSMTNFEPLPEALNSNVNSGKISQLKRENHNDNLKLAEIIKSWNKNLSADDDYGYKSNINKEKTLQESTNVSSSEYAPDINFNNFKNLFINSFTIQNKKSIIPMYDCLDQNILELNLSSKNLTKIESHLFKNFVNLKNLNLEENFISKIENLEKCQNLNTLILNKNKIYRIENLAQISNLERIFLNGNQIQKIENLNFNKKLKTLSLGRNKIDSISDIERQLLFIEELTLCENLIKQIPENFSFPFLKYLDLNDNRISLLNFFLCPNLEKLFLKDNKIRLLCEEDHCQSLKYCQKIRELDLSFNKIENLSDMLKILEFNKNLEVLNVNNNPFSINLKGVIRIENIMMKIFPFLKTFDNEMVEREESNLRNFSGSRNFNNTPPSLDFTTFFNIFNFQNQFMKFFNSVFHVYIIFNKFNFHLPSCDNYKLEFLNLISRNYFKSKTSFIKNSLQEILEVNKSKEKFLFNYHTTIQNYLMKYLYVFKHRFEFLLNSLQFFKFSLKRKKIEKIKKLQRYFRGYIFCKKLKERLRGVDFEYEEESNEELLNFFNSREKLESAKIRMINIERNHLDKQNEKNIIEKIEYPRENSFLIQDLIDFIPIEEKQETESESSVVIDSKLRSLNFLQEIGRKSLEKKLNKDEVNYTTNTNRDSGNPKSMKKINETSHNPPTSKQIQEKIKNLENKIKQEELNYNTNKNIFTNPIETNTSRTNFNQNTPLKRQSSIMEKNRNQSGMRKIYDKNYDSVNIVNILDLAEFPKISQLPNLNLVQSQSFKKEQEKNNEAIPNIRYTPKNDNNSISEILQLPLIGNTSLTGKLGLNEIPTHQSHDSFSIKNNSKISSSGINLNHINEPFKHAPVSKGNTHVSTYNLNKNQYLSTKLQDQIKLIEQECRIAIKNAKEEWKFHNPHTEELLCNKIKKKYKRKIEKLTESG